MKRPLLLLIGTALSALATTSLAAESAANADVLYVTDELRLGLYAGEETSGRTLKTLISGARLDEPLEGPHDSLQVLSRLQRSDEEEVTLRQAIALPDLLHSLSGQGSEVIVDSDRDDRNSRGVQLRKTLDQLVSGCH